MLSTTILAKVKTRQITPGLTAAVTRPLLSQDVIAMLKASYDNSGHKRVRVVCLATDFYLTILLKDVLSKRAGGEAGYDPISHEPCFIFNDPAFLDWAVSFHKAIDSVLYESDQFMFTYLCAAVSGELRHSFGKVGLSTAHSNALKSFGIVGGELSRRATQHAFLKVITEPMLSSFLTLAIDVFGNYKWGGSYGGPKWADIAKAGLDRLNWTLDPISFVDRVYDLKHNGGPIFDKNQAVDNNYVQQLLDAKLMATNDNDWTPWIKYCSKPVRECLIKAKKIGLWGGIDPQIKEEIPSLYSTKEYVTYDPSPDSSMKSPKKPGLPSKPKETYQPDYPVVQDVAACPTGKHHE